MKINLRPDREREREKESHKVFTRYNRHNKDRGGHGYRPVTHHSKPGYMFMVYLFACLATQCMSSYSHTCLLVHISGLHHAKLVTDHSDEAVRKNCAPLYGITVVCFPGSVLNLK